MKRYWQVEPNNYPRTWYPPRYQERPSHQVIINNHDDRIADDRSATEIDQLKKALKEYAEELALLILGRLALMLGTALLLEFLLSIRA